MRRFGLFRRASVARRFPALLGVVAAALLALPLTAPNAAAAAKTGPLSVCYIEVNTYNIDDCGRYTLAANGAQVFDIAVIFAANINYDTSTNSAYLYFNPQVQNVLNNAATTIKPLQAKGIKVYLSILGNHQGAGFANFPDQASAAAFAQQLSNAETQYGLDGIDFDDEYADYGTNGTGQPNAWSFPYLTQALRDDQPNKDMSLYFIGPSSTSLSYGNITVGCLLNYSWNPYYGTWNPPSIPCMSNSQISGAAVDIQSTSSATAASLARETVQRGYGVYMTYDLPDTDTSGYVSAFTNPLYGSNAVFQ